MKKRILSLVVIGLIGLFSTANAQWTQIDNFPSGNTDGSAAFEIDGKVYVTGGLADDGFYQLDTATDTWTAKANVPGGHARGWVIGFSINGMGYVGGGDKGGGEVLSDFYKYDPSRDEWTQIADFGGGSRDGTFACSYNGKGYVFGGFDGSETQFESWSYDPATDKWTQLEHYPGGRAIFPSGFVIGDKIYVGTGSRSGTAGEVGLHAYDPAKNTWEEMASLPGAPRQAGVGFSVDGLGFIGGGQANFTSIYTDFFSYNPETDSWNKVWNLGFAEGSAAAWSTAIAVGDKVYFGTGADFNGGNLNLSNRYYTTRISTSLLSVPNSELSKIKVYPNPTTDEIKFELPNGQRNFSLQVINSLGEVVLKQENATSQLDVSTLAAGVYILRLHSDASSGVTTHKISIQ